MKLRSKTFAIAIACASAAAHAQEVPRHPDKTSSSVKVNGKDYVMPQIEQLRESIRKQFRVGATARNRRECERYGTDMQGAISKIPPEWLAPFLPEGR